MTTSLKNIMLIILFFSVAFNVQGQNVSHLKPITQAKDFTLQERVLLIADQDFYLAGEKLNFFAMTMDAGLQIPVVFSSIIYVELFDHNNSIIASKKILLKSGEAINNLNLPREMKTGYYYLRAYTNYMKNFGPSSFFTKRLEIVNPFLSESSSVTNEPHTNDLKWGFVGEGNNLLYNTENRVVVYSYPAKERVFLRLYKNETAIAEAETKNGTGSFSFTPEEGNTYRIEAAFASGKIEHAEIRNISQAGVICKLDSIQNSHCYLKIITKNFNHFPVTVTVENNGIAYAYPNQVSDSATSLHMQFPAGLNKITIKDANLNTVSERLIYIKPQAKLEIAANFNKTDPSRGDSVVLNLQSATNDSIQYLVAMHLGNENTSPSLADHIETALYNSSVARFTNQVSVCEPIVAENEWQQMNDYISRFQYTSASSGPIKNIQYLPEISHDFLTGRVIAKDNKVPAAAKNIYLAFVDSVCWVNRSKTDSSGRFTAALPIDFQGKDLIVSVSDTVNHFTIICDDEFYPDFLKVAKEDYYPDSSLRSIIEARMINLQINDAYSLLQKPIKKVDRPLIRFYGYPNSEYQFNKYSNIPNLEEFVSEIVKEAYVRRKGTQVNFKVLTGKNDVSDAKPLIIFDGVPLLETERLSPLISTEKLRSIRVVSSRFFFGNDVFEGIIDITSNDKSFALVEKDKNATQVKFSPVISASDINQAMDARVPKYTSAVYFNKISSATGKESVRLRLPQNMGSYSLTLFGYKRNGEWGCIVSPEKLIIK